MNIDIFCQSNDIPEFKTFISRFLSEERTVTKPEFTFGTDLSAASPSSKTVICAVSAEDFDNARYAFRSDTSVGYMIRPLDYDSFKRFLLQTLESGEKRIHAETPMLFKTQFGRVLVCPENILVCIGVDHRVCLRLKNGERHCLRMTMRDAAHILCSRPRFLCCDRCAVVNMDEIVREENGCFILSDNTSVRIRKGDCKKLVAEYESYKRGLYERVQTEYDK